MTKCRNYRELCRKTEEIADDDTKGFYIGYTNQGDEGISLYLWTTEPKSMWWDIEGREKYDGKHHTYYVHLQGISYETESHLISNYKNHPRVLNSPRAPGKNASEGIVYVLEYSLKNILPATYCPLRTRSYHHNLAWDPERKIQSRTPPEILSCHPTRDYGMSQVVSHLRSHPHVMPPFHPGSYPGLYPGSHPRPFRTRSCHHNLACDPDLLFHQRLGKIQSRISPGILSCHPTQDYGIFRDPVMPYHRRLLNVPSRIPPGIPSCHPTRDYGMSQWRSHLGSMPPFHPGSHPGFYPGSHPGSQWDYDLAHSDEEI